MAKKSKEREYQNVNPATGLGTLKVNVGTLEKPQYTTVANIASNANSFKSLVAGADSETLTQLFSVYTRGVESATRVSFKSKHNTTVNLGGGKKIDLLVFAEKKGVKNAVDIINNRLATIELLIASSDGVDVNAVRKREAGWYNTADALVAQGKATMRDGRLTVAA